MSAALFSRPRGLAFGRRVSAAQSTLVMSAFTVTADGATTLTGTYTAKDSSGTVIAGAPVTFAVGRGLVSAALSQVTVNPSTFLADGIQSATMTTTITDTASHAVAGVPSASVVEASTGSNNTLTAVDAVSNYAGAITTTLKTTTAQAKTLSSTVMGQAITDTAAVTSTGGSPTTYVSHGFEDGTIGGFTNPWGDRIDFPNDPTPRATGKVARISYAPASGSSMERALSWAPVGGVRYGVTVWFRGKFFIPDMSGVDADWSNNHNRKLLDFQGTAVRMTLNRNTGNDLRISLVDRMDGTEDEVFAGTTGITILKDTWYTIEVKITTNSADTVRDGVVEVYMNGAVTPDYSKSTDIGWITESGGATSFTDFLVGFQLTINSGDPVYEEYRYWDDCAFSDARLP